MNNFPQQPNNAPAHIPLNIAIAVANDGSAAQMIISLLQVQFSFLIPKGAIRGIANKLIEVDNHMSKMIINPNDKGFRNVD